jgi:hypothetical protein
MRLVLARERTAVLSATFVLVVYAFARNEPALLELPPSGLLSNRVRRSPKE